MPEKTVDLVSPYKARDQFRAFHSRKQRWAIIVAHRRAGKTVACVNEMIMGAARCRLPNPRLAYIAPLYNQAKDVAWGYLKQYTEFIPGTTYNETELRADLPGGARVRLYGADNPDRLRGLYLDGVIMDEYADMDPRMWSEVIRPALSDRQGWGVFIGTPKGRNSFCDMWENANRSADWYALMLRASETGLLADSELADARRAMTPEQYEQEYECSFQAALVGAVYGKEMVAAEKEGRITSVPYDPRMPVHTAWDLGKRNATAIWFCQRVGLEWRLIDYLEESGVGLDWYVKQLREKLYSYGEHILPHDVQVEELSTGRSRLETLESLGLSGIRIAPNLSIEDGINASRTILGACWFDTDKCARGVEALRQYSYEWDDKRKVFQPRPRHDWASDGADALRYLAVGDPLSAGKPGFDGDLNLRNEAYA